MSTPQVFGSADLVAATPTNLFGGMTVGAMFNLSITNRGGNEARVTVGMSTVSGSFQNDKLLSWQQVIPSGGTFEITGLAIGSQHLVIESDQGNVNAIAYGAGLG